MNILIAISDRDLLSGLERLAELSGHSAVAAFDGVQTVSKAKSEAVDIAIVDSRISRIDAQKIACELRELGIKTIILTEEPVNVKLLSEGSAAYYLEYPFEPEDLIRTVERIEARKRSGKTLMTGNTCIDVSKFVMYRIDDRRYTCSEGTCEIKTDVSEPVPLTENEIEVLEKMMESGSVTSKDSVFVSSLCGKLEKAGSDRKIRYAEGKGYGVAAKNE